MNTELSSYEKYARDEMTLVNKDPFIQDLICELLREIDKIDLSAGAIGGFSGFLQTWSEENNLDQSFSDDSLLKPLYDIIKENKAILKRYGYTWNEIVNLLNRVMSFKPLSPLTGEDNEWMEVSENTYQNKRASNIFKTNDKVEWIDGIVFAEPYLGKWSYFTNSNGSRVSITFPFTFPNKPTFVYYTDNSYRQKLPEGIDPEAFIKLRRDKILLGTNPDTNKIDVDFLLVSFSTDEEKQSYTNIYVKLVKIFLFNEHSKHNSEVLQHHALYYCEGPDGADEYYLKMLKGINQRLDALQFNTLARLSLALSDNNKVDEDYEQNCFEIDGKYFKLELVPVKIPTKNYQEWRESGNYILDFVRVDSTNNEYRSDGGYLIYEHDYLYRKRRELGLAHPKRKDHSSNETMDKAEDNYYNEQLSEVATTPTIEFIEVASKNLKETVDNCTLPQKPTPPTGRIKGEWEK